MIDNKNNSKHRSTIQPPRKLRSRQKRARYEEILDDNDEDYFEERYFNVEEKLQCKSFANCQRNCVKEMSGSDVTFEYFQRNGFQQPMVVKDNKNNELGMKIPDKSFTVDDVKQCVGQRRILDVMDVDTQKGKTMTMKEWCNYYNSTDRIELLNVISLEFSHTKLEQFVDSPRIVKQMDWVDLVWPRYLKKLQKEGTNALHEMKYPKVQKYCLMSVKGCYTDFHIDFGGTSVWYHILRGRKIFWLIPPTETNIRSYEKWTLSGEQSKIFFGDLVEHCCRVELESGNTFFIPTGWIHAVYTMEDSLVFGGNFLHSFAIEKQLRVSQAEDVTHVEAKYRYPFFTHLMWYVLVRYVNCLMGRNHLSVDDDGNPLSAEEMKKESNDEKPVNGDNTNYDNHQESEPKSEIKTECSSSSSDDDENFQNEKQSMAPFITYKPNRKIHLTKYEINGLKKLIQWLQQKYAKLQKEIRLGKTNESRTALVPDLIRSPENLLNDARKLIDEHENDDQELAITNRPVLFWFTKKLLAQLNKPPVIKKPSTSVCTTNKQTQNIAPQQHQKIPIKFNSSPANQSSDQPQQQLRQVSLGTTLNYDLISNNSILKGLIEQTGVKTVPSSSSSLSLPQSSSSALNKIEKSEEKDLCKPIANDDKCTTSSSTMYIPPSTNVSNEIESEHNYNVNSSRYYNPYYPHNYAYHPYRSSLPSQPPQQLPQAPNVHHNSSTYVYAPPQSAINVAHSTTALQPQPQPIIIQSTQSQQPYSTATIINVNPNVTQHYYHHNNNVNYSIMPQHTTQIQHQQQQQQQKPTIIYQQLPPNQSSLYYHQQPSITPPHHQPQYYVSSSSSSYHRMPQHQPRNVLTLAFRTPNQTQPPTLPQSQPQNPQIIQCTYQQPIATIAIPANVQVPMQYKTTIGHHHEQQIRNQQQRQNLPVINTINSSFSIPTNYTTILPNC